MKEWVVLIVDKSKFLNRLKKQNRKKKSSTLKKKTKPPV